MRIKLLPLLSVLPVTYAAAIFLTIYLHTTRPFLYLTETLFYAYPQHIHLSALAYLFFLTYPIAGAVSAIAAAAEEGGYDSRQSIVSTTGLTGWALRAILAHQELLRTFPGIFLSSNNNLFGVIRGSNGDSTGSLFLILSTRTPIINFSPDLASSGSSQDSSTTSSFGFSGCPALHVSSGSLHQSDSRCGFVL